MNRALFLATVSAGLGLALFSRAAAADDGPAWLQTTPIVVSGSWDHSRIFETRMGTATVMAAEEFRRERSEETIRRLHDLGVTVVIVPFYKGFGLEAEKDGIDAVRQMRPLLRKYGIRLGVYIGSTIAYETFLAEVPEAKDWFAPDYLGQPVMYFNQYFRKRVYFMHPGYRAYIKKVLRVAIVDLKADLIHFDNTSLQARGPIFHHPLAAADFRTFLRQKYTPVQLRQRLGFSDVSYVEPPTLADNAGSITDPLAQEWTDFRCHQLAAYYAEMRAYIHQLNPEVADDCNPANGMSGSDVMWQQGVDYPRLVPQVDFVWSEEGSKVGLDGSGILWSKIRSYKMATLLGRRIFAYTGSSGDQPKLATAEAVNHPKLAMAEAMAFNAGCLGMVCQPLAAAGMPADQVAYVRFLTRHFDRLGHAQSAAEVAVLNAYSSMAFNTNLPWQSTMLAEQTLLQRHIDFDIIFDAQLAHLEKYRVLVLADQEALSDAQIARISHFVAQGGAVVATEATAVYNEDRLLRPKQGLLERFGAQAGESSGTTAVRGRLGRGRISYLAAILPSVSKPAGVPMSEAYSALPLNAADLVREIDWAAGAGLSFSVTASPGVVAAVAEEADGSRLVHLLNYDPDRQPVQKDIAIDLEGLGSAQGRHVTLLSPDPNIPDARSEWSGDRLHIVVPRLDTYDLLVITR